MFRFSLREILLVLTVCGLSLGWWLDHRTLSLAKAEATEDAEFLATFSEKDEACGVMVASYYLVRQRYGYLPPVIEARIHQ